MKGTSARFQILFCIGLFLSGINSVHAQAPGCPHVSAGVDQNLNCSTNCTTLNAHVFSTGETTDYTVSSIPYAPPYPFTGGTQIFINIDDEWTSTINLPFNFCFYGNMYNKLIIGTNGLISFDLSYASNWCEWSYSAAIPSPGPPPSGIYNNSINGAYHDIDPNVSVLSPTFPFLPTYPANINYAVLGSSPCRTFVVNFSTVRHYSCNNLETTQQIVLYETTNAIEVYIKNKPSCTSWNSGNAVIGLQNANGTKGITPPNRNTGPWSTNNEAWRFTPSGTPNYTFTWYDAAHNALGNTESINVCPTGTSTYTAEAVYQACDGSTVVTNDDVTINIAGGFTSSFTKTDESCAGCDGTVSVTVSGGTPPFTYNIGNGPQAGNSIPGLCAGNYTLTVQDAANCSGTLNVMIAPSSSISVTESFTDETCFGLNDGTITLSGSGGIAPYTYNIGFGAPNNTGSFTALPPNSYAYSVTDATGCSASGNIVISAAQVCCTMTNTIASTNITCNGACNGTITLTENLGIAPVQFSIDNGATFQSTGSFSGLCAGAYDVLITDAGSCQFTGQVVLSEPQAVSVSATSAAGTCGCDGGITITASGGAGAPFQYSIDNGTTFQNSNVFANVCPDSYDVVAKDAAGCTGTATATVGNNGAISITAITAANPSCSQTCDASIFIDAVGAQGYSIDNGATFQAGNNFPNLCAGTYNIVVTDGALCEINDVVTITAPAAITLTATAFDALCNGNCNGRIECAATGGTPPYQYSMDNGTTFQSSNQFSGLCAGVYDMLVSDVQGCTAPVSATVNEPAALSVSVSPTDVLCPQLCNGSIQITVSGGTTPYSFSLPGMTSGSSPQIGGLCAGDYQLTTSDAGNCTATADFAITEPEALIVNAGEDDSVRIGESIVLSPTINNNSLAAALLWSPSGRLNCTDCLNPEANPLTTTIYTFTVNDLNGCAYSDAVQIIVYSNPLVNIPNAFSPNGDGVNDEFEISGMEIEYIQYFVFDRWGEKVFESTDLNTGWDGNYQGKAMLPGVYTYLARVTYLSGDKDVFKGSLTLVK